jgi:CheY-like chemotaxis protein
VRQILTNLVGNAIKFTDTGDVTIQARLVEDTAADVLIRFEVRDSGVGIPPEAQANLFQAFTQADSAITRKYGGTGLGLAICKQLVTLMGGTIGVESTVGQGSTFWFTLRLGKGAAPGITPAAESIPRRGLRVLYVDPHTTSQAVSTAHLRSWGIGVDCVADGAQALACLHQAYQTGQPYALGLLASHLPDMDGMTLGRRIKSDPALADLRLVLLTTFGRRSEGQAAVHAGFAGYIAKPLRQSQLYDCLVTVMGVPDTSVPSTPSTCQPAAERQTPPRLRILVAEDNLVNQRVATRMLEKLGCRVDVVANGQEALNRDGPVLKAHPYHVGHGVSNGRCHRANGVLPNARGVVRARAAFRWTRFGMRAGQPQGEPALNGQYSTLEGQISVMSCISKRAYAIGVVTALTTSIRLKSIATSVSRV